jgi:hypothetical protein
MRRVFVGVALASVLLALPASASAKLAPVEQAWLKPVLAIYNTMSRNLGVVVDEERATNALVAASGKNNTLLSETLALFVSCPSELKAAGPAPTTRLERLRAEMVDACAHLAAGGNDVALAIGSIARGDGSLARADLSRSTAALRAGASALAAAAKQAESVGSAAAVVA